MDVRGYAFTETIQLGLTLERLEVYLMPLIDWRRSHRRNSIDVGNVLRPGRTRSTHSYLLLWQLLRNCHKAGILAPDQINGLAGWQRLFIIEGSTTQRVFVIFAKILPRSPYHMKPIPGLWDLSVRPKGLRWWSKPSATILRRLSRGLRRFSTQIPPRLPSLDALRTEHSRTRTKRRHLAILARDQESLLQQITGEPPQR